MDTANSALLRRNFVLSIKNFGSVKTKSGFAKIYGLCLRFSNWNLSSHTLT